MDGDVASCSWIYRVVATRVDMRAVSGLEWNKNIT